MSRIHPVCLVVVLVLSASFAYGAEPVSSSPGLADWQEGQQAILEGQPEKAIASFQQSLKKDAALVRNHLSLAAAYLAQDKEEKAAEQMEIYLQYLPDHCVVRGQYAELLLRLGRLDEAREQFERFEVDLQERETENWQCLAHCHTRLLDIAERGDDDYGLHLHRGIALYWLACQRSELTDGGDVLSSEGLLCQSASELVLARRARPEEARPCWYLHEVWTRLAQRQPAMRWLCAAEEAALCSYLTPAELRGLHFASRSKAEDGSRK